MYQSEQTAVLQSALDLGQDRATAAKRIADVRAIWAPVWTAFAALRAAHEVLRDAVNSHAAQGTVAQALAALGDAQARLVPLLAARGIK